MSDERLARLVAGGDRAAFGVVFARYHQELYRYCLSLLRDREDAADALQGTMLRALRALEGETREIALRPWLYRIAHNESIDLLRRRPPRSGAGAELFAALDGGVEAGAEARARLQQLLTDLRELPERQRGALVMRELGGLDYDQIAAALETSPAAAKQAVYEARRTLFELAKGRDLDCDGIRVRLSEGDRRAIRARAVRAHLRECSSCRDFEQMTKTRRSALSSLLPGLPAGAAAEIFGGFGSAGIATSAGLKGALAVLTAVVAAGAGATQVLPHASSHAQQAPPAAIQPPAPSSAPKAQPAARTATTHARAGTPQRGHRHAAAGHTRAGNTPLHSRTPDAPGSARGDGAGVPGASSQRPPSGDSGPTPGGGGTETGSSAGPIQTTTQEVTAPVQQTVQQVQGTVDSTVGQVQEALPVKTPSVPRLRLR